MKGLLSALPQLSDRDFCELVDAIKVEKSARAKADRESRRAAIMEYLRMVMPNGSVPDDMACDKASYGAFVFTFPGGTLNISTMHFYVYMKTGLRAEFYIHRAEEDVLCFSYAPVRVELRRSPFEDDAFGPLKQACILGQEICHHMNDINEKFFS